MDESPETSTTRRVLIAVAVLGMPAWVFLAVMALKHLGVMAAKDAAPSVAMPPAGVELSTVPGVSLRRLSRSPSRGSVGGSVASSTGGGHFSVKGSAMDLWAIVRQVVPGRLDGEELLPGSHYEFKIEVTTGGQAEAARRVGKVLEQALGLRLARRTPAMAVLVLSCPDPSAFSMTPSAGARERGAYNVRYGGRDRSAQFTGNMVALARFLEEDTGGRPVVDETGLSGSHSASLRWRSNDRSSLERMLNGYGLKLEAGRRRVEVTFIEKVDSGPTEAADVP